ncbi:hypothetical protein SSX86_008787 [Deinandra increscens subsp. villosa]|uniref:BHLH domain-containing protein n=1 Tax=Deinandra increscens subsp. villosa TaxID=3103831 RepID=A0AAP0DJT7_9ASTR
MEASSFHRHPSVLHQCFSFSDLMATNTSFAHQSYEHVLPTTSSIESTTHIDSNLQILDSSLSMEVYVSKSAEMKMPTSKPSLSHAQSNVRREKISEKMKALQSIVPGCDKISGVALMLDEVINYVHSLQNEIQIMSLKLAYVNPMDDYGAEYEECIPRSYDQNTTIQQQMLSFQEHQMPCMISQNNGEALWDLEEQREEFDDLFAIIKCNSCY